MSNRLDNLICTGAATFGGAVYLPDEVVTNGNVQTGAGIDASKLKHTHRKTYTQTGTATTATIVLHRVNGATASGLYVNAGSIAIAVGAATVTIDIKKNGTSVMTGATPMTLDSANTAYVAEDASIATTTAVVGDVFTAVIVATAGGGTLPTGLWIEFEIDEVYTT